MAPTLSRIALLLALFLAGCGSVPDRPEPPAAPRPATLEDLEHALQRDPDDPEISIAIGRIELERGNPRDAYVAFRRAAALAPDDLRAVSGLALSADALGFDDEAAAAYERWGELERSSGAGPDRAPDPW